jgi:hypothetical protein
MSKKQKYWVDDNDQDGDPSGKVEQVVPADLLAAEAIPAYTHPLGETTGYVEVEKGSIVKFENSPIPVTFASPVITLETMSDEEIAREMAKRRIKKLDQQILEAEAVVKALRSQRELLAVNPVGALIDGHTAIVGMSTIRVNVSGGTNTIVTTSPKRNLRGCTCGNPEGCYKCL